MPTESRTAMTETEFAEFFAQYRKRIWAAIDARLNPRTRVRGDADDLVQQVYLKARERLDDLPELGQPLLNWLCLQARDVIANHHAFNTTDGRNIEREQQQPPEAPSGGSAMQPADPHSTPSQHVAKEELQQIMRERFAVVFARLSPEDQEVIRLDMDGLNLAEIAQKLGITHAAARKRHSRAKRRLLQLRIELYGEPESLP